MPDRVNNRDKTECPKGHPYSPENTYYAPNLNYRGKVCRVCRICNRARTAAAARKRREKKRQALIETGGVPRFEDSSGQVYFISDVVGHVKIGVTSNDPILRMTHLQSAHPGELRLELILPGGYPTERRLHEQFASAHIRGEWFHFTPEIAHYIDVAKDMVACTSQRATRPWF